VKPVSGIDFVKDTVETDGIPWFAENEVARLETRDNIRKEIMYAFKLRLMP